MTQFAKTLNHLAASCGKSEYQLAQLSGLDRPYLSRLLDGEKDDPSLETLMRIWVGLVADPDLAKRQPYLFEQGLTLLVHAAAMSNAPLKVAVGKLERRRKPELQLLSGD